MSTLIYRRRALASVILTAGLAVSLCVFPRARATSSAVVDAVVYLDLSVLDFLNRFARRSLIIDALIWRTDGSYFLQGGVLMALFWGAWFSGDEFARGERREMILVSLVSVYAAAVIAIALRLVLPFRVRPYMEPTLGFQLPYMPIGVSTSANFSTSFPSGHALVFFALVAGLASISRILAVVAGVYVTVVVCIPRVYLGLHYPTDILAGACVAILSVSLLSPFLRKREIFRWLIQESERHATLFYGLWFLVSLDIAMEFRNARVLIRLAGGPKFASIVGD